MSEHLIVLRERYLNPLFFSTDQLVLSEEKSERTLFEPLFFPDIQAEYFAHYPPWEQFEHWLPILLGEWKILQEELYPIFEERSKESEPLMIKAIAILFMMLFWSNGRSVQLKEWESAVPGLSISFVNPVERVSFIVNRPAVYFSYIQLGELITELHKAIEKDRVMKKRKRT
ncbi:YpoC family protein [Jeotgalibacillus soli]|uniref:YpoC-like domain-containing protein n=1 Tax=Jeotgalibacillus soli TaxID=889306 RepID=A0A0C2V577_9BACL|nr:hypothetical protein [Jeotgalibacillus soli]KIL44167.1 hypothetical protein KP78_31310 [Jeotgalibacillus soli]